MFRLAVTARAHATRTLSTSLPRFNAAAAAQPEIRARLKDALKTAMKSKDKEATGCIRVSKSDAQLCIVVLIDRIAVSDERHHVL